MEEWNLNVIVGVSSLIVFIVIILIVYLILQCIRCKIRNNEQIDPVNSILPFHIPRQQSNSILSLLSTSNGIPSGEIFYLYGSEIPFTSIPERHYHGDRDMLKLNRQIYDDKPPSYNHICKEILNQMSEEDEYLPSYKEAIKASVIFPPEQHT